MENELLYRISFIIMMILIIGIRLFGHQQAGTLSDKRERYSEGLITKIMRPLPILVLIGAVAYVVNPELMAWSSITLPDWLRVIGILLSGVSVLGMVWVHRALSKHFSGRLEIREDHTLVKDGPYRWVRHPMYTVVLLMFFAIFLMTANWFIGLGGLLMVLIVVIARTPREEAMLLHTFGDEYQMYMQQTPRYLPRLRISAD